MIKLYSREVACREVVALLTDYLDGALSPRRRARLERHLAGCPACSAYLAQLRATIGVAGTLRPDDVPEPVMDELLEVFRRYSDEPDGGS